MSDAIVPRATRDLGRAGTSLWEGVKGLIDRWFFGGSVAAVSPPERALYTAAAVVAGIGTVVILRITWSVSRAWAHYTRGRLSGSALAGQVILFAPAAVAAGLTGYFVRRARGEGGLP